MALIQTTNLKKIYKTGKNITTPALRGINLQINKGEFVAIAGPSGSGKSSLLHLLGGLDSASEGSILFDGMELTQIPSNRLAIFRLLQIGFVFQAYNLINTLTAFENVEYVMLLQGVPGRERRKRADEILKRVGLSDFAKRFPNEMSGGQQQRVAVARAIAPMPRVILADEPTANLDSRTAESLLELMLQLNREKGITFVFSTHDKTVMDKAKRLILMRDGEIVI